MELTVKKRRPWWMTPFGREPVGDVFFDRLWPEWQRDMGEEWVPGINFYEKEGKYYLTAELPGMSKDDINISVDQGIITLSGKKEQKREEENASYYLREVSYGSFSRSFRLPTEVEEDKVEADFKDGLLTVVMPHRKEPKARKIEIK